MLFETEGFLESYKERNLYYKFFAGYFFNELIDGLEERLKYFSDLTNKSFCYVEKQEGIPKVELTPASTHVTFDVHEYQYVKKDVTNENDNLTRGEFADFLIEDLKSNVCISVEAKYRSNWDFHKDILANCERLKNVMKKSDVIKTNHPELKKPQLIHLLLVSCEKWKNGKNKKNRNLIECGLWNEEEFPKVGVLFWEDFIHDCCPQSVSCFLEKQLNDLYKPWANGDIKLER